jgi:hypothetical protein
VVGREHDLATRPIVSAASKRTDVGQWATTTPTTQDLQFELRRITPTGTLVLLVALCVELRSSDYAPTRAATKPMSSRKGQATAQEGCTCRSGQWQSALGKAFQEAPEVGNRTTTYTLHESRSAIDCYMWLRWDNNLNGRRCHGAYRCPQLRDGKLSPRTSPFTVFRIREPRLVWRTRVSTY